MTDLPQDVQATAEELTHRARRANDEAAAQTFRERRDELLADHGYSARVREGDDVPGVPAHGSGANREVLVLYPDDWLDDGTVRTDRIEDLDRAVEIPLTGPGDPDDWDAVDEHNREIAARVRERHGDVHGDNADAFADFMSNHYAKRIERATEREIQEFLGEYFPRNAWPSDEQRAVVEESITHVTADDGEA